MNKFCIVRGDNSGVFAGTVTEHNGKEVTMTNVRRLWRWSGATETLQLALEGVNNPSECRFTVIVPELMLNDANTVIPCTPEAKNNLEAVEVWKA